MFVFFCLNQLKFKPLSEFQIAFPGCRHESNTNEGSPGPVVAQLQQIQKNSQGDLALCSLFLMYLYCSSQQGT